MKTLRTSLALILLLSLFLPCICIGEDHHQEAMETMTYSVEDTCGKACLDESCSDSPEISLVKAVPPLNIPIRQMNLITILETDPPVSRVPSRPFREPLLLRTVQLLI